MCSLVAWMGSLSGEEMRVHLRTSPLSIAVITSPSSPLHPLQPPSLHTGLWPLAVVLDLGLGRNNTNISEKKGQRGNKYRKEGCLARHDLFRRNGWRVRTLKKCSRISYITPDPQSPGAWKSSSMGSRMPELFPLAQPSIVAPLQSEPGRPL